MRQLRRFEKLAPQRVAGAAVRGEGPFRGGVIVLMVMADISINLSEYQKRIFSPGPTHGDAVGHRLVSGARPRGPHPRPTAWADTCPQVRRLSGGVRSRTVSSSHCLVCDCRIRTAHLLDFKASAMEILVVEKSFIDLVFRRKWRV